VYSAPKITAVLVHTRRKKIIKCCGIGSCSSKRAGNGTKLAPGSKLVSATQALFILSSVISNK
jgi:hypothetical protein